MAGNMHKSYVEVKAVGTQASDSQQMDVRR